MGDAFIRSAVSTMKTLIADEDRKASKIVKSKMSQEEIQAKYGSIQPYKKPFLANPDAVQVKKIRARERANKLAQNETGEN